MEYTQESLRELAERIYDLDAEVIPVWDPLWAACSTATGNAA